MQLQRTHIYSDIKEISVDQKHQCIKHFAVEVLGCGCPEEVFQTIETGKIDIAGPAGSDIARILIGNRLLIYLVPVSRKTELAALLADFIKTGTSERDSKGYNRFRLVLVTEDSDFDRAGAAFLFSTLVHGDDRLFLHTVEKENLSELLEYI